MNEPNGIGAALSRTVDGLGRLVGEHLTLARLELVEDARAVGGDLGRMALFAPLVLVGWGLTCGALALLLSFWVGLVAAFGMVGLLNLGAGIFGIVRTASRMKTRRVMDDTLDEVGRSASVLTNERERMGAAHDA